MKIFIAGLALRAGYLIWLAGVMAVRFHFGYWSISFVIVQLVGLVGLYTIVELGRMREQEDGREM